MWGVFVAGAALAAGTPGGDRAAGPHPLVEAIAACLAMPDEAQRLACTQAAASRLVAAERAHDIVVIDRAEVRRARRSVFGLVPADADVLAEHLPPAERVERLDTTLRSAAAVADGRWVIALAEGGRWQTAETWQPLAALRPGAAAEVRGGMLGSYVLRLPGQRPVRVRRID